MSVCTMYSYLDQGLFTARNIDLKRKVRFRPGKCHKIQINDRSVFPGRLYSDFCNLNLSSHVEMDTVHSSRDSKENAADDVFYKGETVSCLSDKSMYRRRCTTCF